MTEAWRRQDGQRRQYRRVYVLSPVSVATVRALARNRPATAAREGWEARARSSCGSVPRRAPAPETRRALFIIELTRSAEEDATAGSLYQLTISTAAAAGAWGRRRSVKDVQSSRAPEGRMRRLPSGAGGVPNTRILRRWESQATTAGRGTAAAPDRGASAEMGDARGGLRTWEEVRGAVAQAEMTGGHLAEDGDRPGPAWGGDRRGGRGRRRRRSWCRCYRRRRCRGASVDAKGVALLSAGLASAAGVRGVRHRWRAGYSGPTPEAPRRDRNRNRFGVQTTSAPTSR